MYVKFKIMWLSEDGSEYLDEVIEASSKSEIKRKVANYCKRTWEKIKSMPEFRKKIKTPSLGGDMDIIDVFPYVEPIEGDVNLAFIDTIFDELGF
jgi:hypothetical protein